jgi:hypothetical protein
MKCLLDADVCLGSLIKIIFIDSDVRGKYAEIQQHVFRQNQYTEQAKEEFVQSIIMPIRILIACLFQRMDIKGIKCQSPNGCRTFEVGCINIFQYIIIC